MSFDPGEHRSEIPYCPSCCEDKAPHFTPRPCAEPGCKVFGCSHCLTRCDIGVHAGGFCGEHIHLTEMYPGGVLNSCAACKALVESERETPDVPACLHDDGCCLDWNHPGECVPPQPVVAMEKMEEL
jgi:hypothetical protein